MLTGYSPSLGAPVTCKAYQKLEESVAEWCDHHSDIYAAVVIGSRGRPAGAPDDHSDLDLILFCGDAGQYQHSQDWLDDFGQVWIAALNFVGPGHPEWMAYLDPGLKVDFLFVSASADHSLTKMLESLPYQHVLDRGFRVLYRSETAGLESLVTRARTPPPTLPRELDFHQKLNTLLLSAERFVKFANREDWWRSRYTFEAELKNHLLVLLEWHARSAPGPVVDTWYEGRHMETWADPRVVEAARHLEAGKQPQQQLAALLAMLDMVVLLAGETAVRLGYDFPTPGQDKMMAWLKLTMAGLSDPSAGRRSLTP